MAVKVVMKLVVEEEEEEEEEDACLKRMSCSHKMKMERGTTASLLQTSSYFRICLYWFSVSSFVVDEWGVNRA